MPGSMRKRGDSWELRVYAGTDPETGKRKWVSATTKGTRRAAQRELVEFAARVNYPRRMTQRRPSQISSTTGTRQCRRTGHRPRLARRRASSIATLYRVSVTFSCRRFAPKTSTPSMASCADAADATASRCRRARCIGFMSCSTGHWPKRFAGNGSGSIPPVRRRRRRASRPRSIPRVPKRSSGCCLTWQRVDPEFHTFLSLAVSTGARRSQLGALRWGDVDLEQGQIGFLRALLDAKGGPVLRPTKTGRTYRVNLDADCLAVLTGHYERAKERANGPESTSIAPASSSPMISPDGLLGGRTGSPNNSSPIAAQRR